MKMLEWNVKVSSNYFVCIEFTPHYNIGSFPVHASPSVGNFAGGDIIFITGPTFQPNDIITCIFGNTETDGAYHSVNQGLCVSPAASHEEVIDLTIKITRGKAVLTGATKYRYSMFLVNKLVRLYFI